MRVLSDPLDSKLKVWFDLQSRHLNSNNYNWRLRILPQKSLPLKKAATLQKEFMKMERKMRRWCWGTRRTRRFLVSRSKLEKLKAKRRRLLFSSKFQCQVRGLGNLPLYFLITWLMGSEDFRLSAVKNIQVRKSATKKNNQLTPFWISWKTTHELEMRATF